MYEKKSILAEKKFITSLQIMHNCCYAVHKWSAHWFTVRVLEVGNVQFGKGVKPKTVTLFMRR